MHPGKMGSRPKSGASPRYCRQGRALCKVKRLALTLLLRHTSGPLEVTVDCRPAILQAGSSNFRAAHANIWEEVWEDRNRLRKSPGTLRTALQRSMQERYGSPDHWRVQLNDTWRTKRARRQLRQSRGDSMQSLLPSLTSWLTRSTTSLPTGRGRCSAGPVAPPLDVKPRHQPKGQLPPKRKTQAQATAQTSPSSEPACTRTAVPNKKQRLETLLSTAHLHGHTFAWSHTNPNNHSLKCSTCSLFIQQVHPTRVL